MTRPIFETPRAPKIMAREAGRQVFGSGAAGYHAVRSDYPDELFEHLFARAGRLNAVLEIGPGSGIATTALLERSPRRYVGVESDPHFVDFLRRRFPQSEVELVCAPFPVSGLEGPFDLAVCAAAFHWLDPEPSLAVLRKLLRPDGIWAMWWNSYLDTTEDHPFGQAAMALLQEHGVRLPPSFGPAGHLSQDVARQVALLESNGFRDVEVRNWRRTRPLDAAQVRELFDSFSFVRLLPSAERASLFEALSHVVSEQFGGRVDNFVSTACYTASPD